MAAASGKLKLTAKPAKMKVPKNLQKKMMNYGSGGATSGCPPPLHSRQSKVSSWWSQT